MTAEMWGVSLIFLLTYTLIASEKIPKVAAAMFGATAVVLAGFAPLEKLFEKVELNVIFLLTGMMIVVSVLARTGVFEWIAIIIAQKSKGYGVPIVLEFLIATTLLSAILDNVTTVVLVAPITILVTQILEIPTAPLLIAEAVFSNIGGTATLIGDPPNIVIGAKSGFLTFNDFIIHLTPCVLLIMTLTLVMVFIFMRKKFRVNDVVRKRVMMAYPAQAIVEPKILKRGLAVFALILFGFAISHNIEIDPGLIALTGGLLMAVVCQVSVHRSLAAVEWETIFFFIGLFMLIGALEVVGIFDYLGEYLLHITSGDLLLTAMLVLWASAFLSAIVDNIPLVIAMMPLLANIIPNFAAQMGITEQAQINLQIAEPLYWSLALGACLGGNGSLIGASANVVIAQIGNRNKSPISFIGFTKFGFPVMILSLLVSTVYIYVRYF